MAIIPQGTYRKCEQMLYRRFDLIAAAQEELREARARAYAAGGQALDPIGGGNGTPSGDALERKAISAAEAENRLREALAWDDVLRKLDRIYPATTKEGRAAWLLYGWRTGTPLTVERVRRLMNVDRKTVRGYRDTYVVNCCLLAATAGLIRIHDGNY